MAAAPSDAMLSRMASVRPRRVMELNESAEGADDGRAAATGFGFRGVLADCACAG
jgi:hypothetical protein